MAITGASNVTGYVPDIHSLAINAHAAGAQILADGAQLAPYRCVDMGHLANPTHLDYVTVSAHKMYAPFGTGALIARRDTFEQDEPEYRGGGTIDVVSLDSITWADAPDRDEAGTPNVAGAVALAAAINALSDIVMERIASHEPELTSYALDRMAKIDGLQIYGDADPLRASQRLGVIAFNLTQHPHALVAAILGTEFGIGVRNGCFCAYFYLINLLGTDRDDVHLFRSGMPAIEAPCPEWCAQASVFTTTLPRSMHLLMPYTRLRDFNAVWKIAQAGSTALIDGHQTWRITILSHYR